MNPELLVELYTEELPPKALADLSAAFSREFCAELASAGLIAADVKHRSFATPRRLAILIPDVPAKSASCSEVRKLMPAKVAYGADGKPTPALVKRLEKDGIAVESARLEKKTEGNADYVYAHVEVGGVPLAQGAQAALDRAIARLPVPKVMGYQLADGVTTVQFVRPAHGLVALHGSEVLPLAALGLKAGRVTHGHRFQGVKDIEVATANAYEEALRAHGNVIASFEERRADIRKQLEAKAKEASASLGPDEAVAPLLDEVTALVEYPTVYAGKFEAEFLAVPQECLILTMRANQKYFPLFDENGALINTFLITSNMRLANPRNVVEGNERVVRPRLADARFFFETDKKTRLAERVPQLGSVTYHNKLGSQLARVGRVEAIAQFVAGKIGADAKLAKEAAHLAKADLVTNMVGEFPELQGIMGGYYAAHDGAPASVVRALKDQYRLRFPDLNNEVLVSACLYLADRAELLVGMFGIGNVPSGDRDPFGLRRAALGMVSVFELLGQSDGSKSGQRTTLGLRELLECAAGTFAAGTLKAGSTEEVEEFVYERYRNQLATQHPRAAVDAVIALKPPLDEVLARVAAVVEFQRLPEAEALAAANKRIRNILKKSEGAEAKLNSGLLVEAAEKALHSSINDLAPAIEGSFSGREYTAALKTLAGVRTAVDAFFDKVMVNAEDKDIRANRLALLRQLDGMMNRVADISRLAA